MNKKMILPHAGKSKNTLMGCIVFVTAIFLFCCNTNNSKKDAINVSSIPAKNTAQENNGLSKSYSEPDSQSHPYIIKSIKEFKNRFNAYFAKYECAYRVRNVAVEEGAVNNTFTYMFDDNVGLVGSINKTDHSIKELMMIGKGDGTIGSGANIIFVMGGIITSADPTLLPAERGQILRDLGLLGDDVDLKDLHTNTVRNGIKYWLVSSDAIGISFGASPQES